MAVDPSRRFSRRFHLFDFPRIEVEAVDRSLMRTLLAIVELVDSTAQITWKGNLMWESETDVAANHSIVLNEIRMSVL